MNVIGVDVVSQARLMLQRLEADRPGSVNRLHTDALAELGTWTDVQVRRVPDTAAQTRCSVAGGYVHSTNPPTLTVTRSLSHRRQQFTALHELGHHLQKHDVRLAVAVRRQPANNEAFEDAACDMFASLVLVPDDVLPSQPEGRSPSAADVVAVFERTQASRAACCVRMASRLGTHGVITVLDATGTVSFAVARGEVYPPARGSSQASTPLVAAARCRGGNARTDETYVQYRSGDRSELLYGDAVWSGEYLVTVAVLDRPGWKQFAPPRIGSRQFAARDWTCEMCGEEFTPDGSCANCSTPRCSAGHCTCTLAAERQCHRCFQLLGPSRFPSRADSVCRDCAG
ncbi:ImmA/IrrE family metallo-endopeptidase [Pseudonocardia xinjiangensis]|uniref:ImmA/IrrE family metallo-endopeptidase n=1 Tax=Pseudonocardia xinjiangensis TaxID=75289 RepID=UPI003D8D6C14